MSGPLDYRHTGVDLDVAAATKARFRALVESTRTDGALGRFGGFGGMFRMPADVDRPVLIASADGVGTKIKVAIEAGRHDTIGHDLVNHCVNDILVQGARPLFFLDYVAFGRLDSAVAEAIVAGVAAGCRENGCALIGGETAQMPDLYTPPDYDLAGFIVGYVAEDRVLGPDRVSAGNVLIGLESNGLHTNGYSLARRIVTERLRLGPHAAFPGGGGTVADVLLRVHRSYLGALVPELHRIRAMAHITGGGLEGNVSRVMPEHLDATIRTKSWTVPTVFTVLQQAGEVAREEMFRVFNMGVGMVVIAAPDDADAVIRSAAAAGVGAWRMGEVGPGSGRVILN